VEFLAQLEDYRCRVDGELDRRLPPEWMRPSQLHGAMRYAVFSGGKRLRPTIVVGVADCFSSAIDPNPAAAAVECLHTYTLVHDDLPCCDDDNWRRGLPTCHRRFDEVTALLAGDALLTEAFRILAHSYPLEIAARCVQILSRASCSTGLVGGQMEDCGSRTSNIRSIRTVHYRKTACLIEACFELGGYLSGTLSAIPLLRTIGVCVGFAFQIQDDLLDASGEAQSYVSAYGEEASCEMVRRLYSKALSCIQKTGGDNTFLCHFVSYMAARSS
jgi:geranylgeranyl pyrophosphate synthase